jgi:5'(3')-deoxyribonucleotidase
MQKLFLDFDCTIVDSIKAYCEVYNKQFKDEQGYIFADYNKVARYDLKDQCHLVDHQERIFSNEVFFQHADFMPGAEAVIQKLAQKYKIVICSIGSLDNISFKSQWIKNNMPYITDVVLISSSIGSSGIKMDKSVVNMVDSIFIDDHADNLFSSNAKIKICYGKEYVWNESWTGNRCFNWKEVEAALHD